MVDQNDLFAAVVEQVVTRDHAQHVVLGVEHGVAVGAVAEHGLLDVVQKIVDAEAGDALGAHELGDRH